MKAEALHELKRLVLSAAVTVGAITAVSQIENVRGDVGLLHRFRLEERFDVATTLDIRNFNNDLYRETMGNILEAGLVVVSGIAAASSIHRSASFMGRCVDSILDPKLKS